MRCRWNVAGRAMSQWSASRRPSRSRSGSIPASSSAGQHVSRMPPLRGARRRGAPLPAPGGVDRAGAVADHRARVLPGCANRADCEGSEDIRRCVGAAASSLRTIWLAHPRRDARETLGLPQRTPRVFPDRKTAAVVRTSRGPDKSPCCCRVVTECSSSRTSHTESGSAISRTGFVVMVEGPTSHRHHS